jgi:putative ABC transport system permease protein
VSADGIFRRVNEQKSDQGNQQMLMQDIKYAVRTLRKTPAMTLTVIAVLALGIGANTALFTVVNTVLLRPLNFPNPERIVTLQRHWPGFDAWSVTPTKFDFWRRESHSFAAIAAVGFAPVGLNLAGMGEPQRLASLPASSEYFQVLGVSPLLGRTFSADEDKRGSGDFAVLSYSLWQSLFHGDPKVVGRSISLSHSSYEVLGVMPANFDFPQRPDLWTPLQLQIDPSDLANDYEVMARLKPGVSLENAQQDLQLVAQRFRNAYGSNLMSTQESISILRYHDWIVGDVRPTLFVLLIAVGFVLLIACANVANLLLARSAAREHEMGIRVALGASSSQIVRQLLTESLLLSAAGTVGGLLLARASMPLLVRLAPANMPQLMNTTIDRHVLLYAIAIAIFTGVLFGLFPALQSKRLGIANPLRESGTRTTSNRAANRVRQCLVIGEVAISLVLLAGASLLLKTISNLEDVRPGFDPHNVLTMQMSLQDDRYKTAGSVAQLTTKIVTRLEALPGVTAAATTNLLPMNPYFDLPFEIIGHPTTRENMPDERYRFVSPHYFSALKIPIVAGRAFSERDTSQAVPVIIINEAFAREYFPKQNPLGQQILVGRIMGSKFADKPRQIVGVVGSIRDEGLGKPAPAEMFEPAAQVPDSLVELDNKLAPLSWVVQMTRDPMSMAEQIRRETLAVSGGIPMAEPKPLEETVSTSVARQRFTMTLLSIFAGLAAFLAAIGLYGVISYSVAQRTRELGIRSALGARRGDLLALIIGQGFRLVGIGLGIGVLAALGVTRFLQGMLYDVKPSDPVLLLEATALMGFVALAACWFPARRAARIDPLVALRED